MPRKRSDQPKPVDRPTLPILKLGNVPGPEADANDLRTHYRRVKEVMAIHAYDDVINACHWCCGMEEPLAYSKVDNPRSTHMFCSGRCASAYGEYRANTLGKRAEGPKPSAPEPTDNETPLDPEPENGEGEPVSEEHYAESPADAKASLERTAERLRESEWQASKASSARKPRKPREAKPAREDGKCAKGLHEMTPENTYSTPDGKGAWCKECRKASRAKSKSNGGSK